MTVNPQVQQIQIRLLLPLYGDGAQIDAILERADGQPFNLLPIRYRENPATASSDSQWYCQYTDRITVRVQIQLNGQIRQWEPQEIVYTKEKPLALGLGRSGTEPLFFLIQGILLIPIVPEMQVDDSPLQSLWITGDAAAVQFLLFHPTGLHLAGTLPAPFYASGQQQLTVLRVPQTPLEDEIRSDDPLAQAFPDLNLEQQRFWSLQALELPQFTELENHSAIEQVKDWANYLEQFRLPEDRKLQTFVDNIECQAGENCIVQIFQLNQIQPDQIQSNQNNGELKTIYWIGKFINTRISIGGSDVAEASFQPQFLTGQLQQGRSGQWTGLQVQFETSRSGATVPDIQLSLMRLSTILSGNGVLQTPGKDKTGKDRTTIKITVIDRSADFTNEFGLFQVDDAEGRVDGLLPGDAGYAAAALADTRRLLLLSANQSEVTQTLTAGMFVGSYLIQNDTAAGFLARNRANDPNRVPLAFFSVAANPDGQVHAQWNETDGLIQLAWEDSLNGGDRDFDDLVITLAGAESVQGSVEFRLAETPMQAIAIPSRALPLKVPEEISVYRSWMCTETGWLAIDSTAPEANIDPEQVTQGAVFGTIDLNKLYDRLQISSGSTDTSVQAQTLAQSCVAVRWQPNQLSLEISKPLLTLISPPVWFQDADNPTSAQTPFILPTLTSPSDETDPEQILRARLLPAVFVSAAVVKPQSQGRLPISAIVQFEQLTFQFKLKHGIVADKPQPLFAINPTLQIELDQSDRLAAIRQQFEMQKRPLSRQVDVIVKQADRLWLLIDRTSRRSYWIRKENAQENEVVPFQLNIYQPLLNTDENLAVELDAEKAERLQDLFVDQQIILSQNLSVIKGKEPQTWMVFDRDERRSYLVEQTVDQFSVYPIPSQQLLAWNQFASNAAVQTRNYPLVQSFPVPSGNNQQGFLDSNRGLLPCQPATVNESIGIRFSAGLPAYSVENWQLVTPLITTRYFLPTLPGIELDLNAQPIQWLYRHSVPVLDEAYAEVSEIPADPIANSGNVEGRDFTRIRGTEAFRLLPAELPRQTQGWLHKTNANPDGAVEIQFNADDAQTIAGLAGPSPQLDFTIANQQSITLSRSENTGGVTFPLQVEVTPTGSLPDFTVTVGKDAAPYEISSSGQPLIATFAEDLQRIVTLDGSGQVQEEPIGAFVTQRQPQQDPQRFYTGSFELLPQIHLDLISVQLGEFSAEVLTDTYAQRWMLHDGKGGWAKLKGFALYPLRLQQFTEENNQFTIVLQAVWLHTTPQPNQAVKPSRSGAGVTLTAKGNLDNWELTLAGAIDWRFPLAEESDRSVQLARLQANIPSQSLTDPTLQLEQTELTIAHPIGLIQLTETIGRIEDAGQCKVTAQSSSTDFEYSLSETAIEAEQEPSPLQNYRFRWYGSKTLSAPPASNVTFLEPTIRDGVLQVADSKGASISIVRDGSFANEFGLFQVDNAEGQINGLSPGNSGYARAALERRLVTVKPDQNQAQVTLPQNSQIALYLIQNDSAENFLSQNPENDRNKTPTAFFSILAANPDRQEHVRWKSEDNTIIAGWEDILDGGDRDFDDLIATLVFLPNPIVLSWELTFEAETWHFQVGSDMADPIALSLDAYRISPQKFIFAPDVLDSSATASPDSLPPIATNSWFERAEADRGLVAAEFNLTQATAPALSALVADLQLRLWDRLQDTAAPVSDRTRLIARLKLDLIRDQNAIFAEMSGVLALDNAIRFVDALGDCAHWVKLYFDRAQIPIAIFLAFLAGKGSGSPFPIAGIAAHTFQLGNGKTFQWQSPQTIRLTTVERFAKTFLPDLPGSAPDTLDTAENGETALAIEAGAVFELSGQTITAASNQGTDADLNDSLVQLFVRQQSQSIANPSSFVVRLPLVTLKSPEIPERLPVIRLQETNSDGVYQIYETRIDRQPLIPPLTAPAPFRSPDILKRTLQAQWLDSGYLGQLLAPELGQSADLQPAFLNEQNQITLKLPSTLGDLEWLRESTLGENLTAATLITAYALNQAVPEIDQPVRFEYPFSVSERSASDAAATENFQLISFINGNLQQIAQEETSNQDPLQWGRARLQEKRRYDASIVLQAFKSPVLIPRSFEALRETLANFSQWSLDLPARTDAPYGEDLDSRCQLPTVSRSESQTGQSEPKTIQRQLQSDARLGMMVFDAAPQRPTMESRLKSAAATRFRLAPTAGNAADAGKLRPAQTPTADAKGLFAIQKWDEVAFVQSTREPNRPNVSPAYPAVNPGTVGQHPSFDHTLLQAIASADNEISPVTSPVTPLLPPLVDVVAWACRPGEMTRSLWSLNRLSVSIEAQQQIQQIATSHFTSVNLRRPRAVAAPDEQVQLEVVQRYQVFNQKFNYAKLRLTQVMGITAKPEPQQVYGVLANKNHFFQSAPSRTEATNPALLSYKLSGSQKQLEAISLYFVADRAFAPRQFDSATSTQQLSKTVLFWTKEGQAPNTLPDTQATILIEDLPNPTDSNSQWQQLEPSQDTYVLNITNTTLNTTGNLEQAIEAQIPSDGATSYLVLAQYQATVTGTGSPTWNKTTDLFVLPIGFVNQNSQILSPKSSVALLAVPSAKEEANPTTLLSYGRLSNDDFSPIRVAASDDRRVEWVRQANLQTLDRTSQTGTGNSNTVYDLIFYGSGGELIPSRVISDKPKIR
ncbi:DUF4114 domain-containing protein [Leptolyngbya sp. GB1-A1]|uniref:DUF4114 domain-containing protein n=1 Tax=Leptolyngbya sp. GB1-A1 TaxID=2933908 RepID=UPI003297BC30